MRRCAVRWAHFRICPVFPEKKKIHKNEIKIPTINKLHLLNDLWVQSFICVNMPVIGVSLWCVQYLTWLDYLNGTRLYFIYYQFHIITWPAPVIYSVHKIFDSCTGFILCMHPSNERRRYIVTLSLIGWAHTQNDPCMYSYFSPALQNHILPGELIMISFDAPECNIVLSFGQNR